MVNMEIAQLWNPSKYVAKFAHWQHHMKCTNLPLVQIPIKLIQRSYLLLLSVTFACHGKYRICATLKPERIRCKFRGLNLNKICSLATSQQALTKSKAAFVYFLYSLSIHQLYTLAISEVSTILFVYSNQMIPLTHFGVYTFCILHDHHLYKKYTNLCETPWPFQMMYTFCILHGLGHTKSIHSLKMIQLWWIEV